MHLVYLGKKRLASRSSSSIGKQQYILLSYFFEFRLFLFCTITMITFGIISSSLGASSIYSTSSMFRKVFNRGGKRIERLYHGSATKFSFIDNSRNSYYCHSSIVKSDNIPKQYLRKKSYQYRTFTAINNNNEADSSVTL